MTSKRFYYTQFRWIFWRAQKKPYIIELWHKLHKTNGRNIWGLFTSFFRKDNSNSKILCWLFEGKKQQRVNETVYACKTIFIKYICKCGLLLCARTYEIFHGWKLFPPFYPNMVHIFFPHFYMVIGQKKCMVIGQKNMLKKYSIFFKCQIKYTIPLTYRFHSSKWIKFWKLLRSDGVVNVFLFFDWIFSC